MRDRFILKVHDNRVQEFNGDGSMEILIFLFKSGLSMDRIAETSEVREEKYRKVKGLLQKYYVMDRSTGHVGGVFVFDSKESLRTFRDSELAKSTGEAYQFPEQPQTRFLETAKNRFEK